MSATGRGASRRERDAYFTPAWITHAIMPVIKAGMPAYDEIERPCVLEPSCGDGAVMKVIREHLPHATVDAIDLAPVNVPGAPRADFLALEPSPVYDLIMGNPPYSHALEFCQRAMEWIRPNGQVAMLLRLGFLASRRRKGWLMERMPSVYVSPRRPSFTGKGTDSCDYCWVIWRDTPPTIALLDT